MKNAEEYRFNRFTWQEMNEVIEQKRVAVLPTGSTEQHGPHLPLDVDQFLCEAVCLEAGKRAPELMVVLPPISYGLNLHHMDFPGTIHIEPEIFIAFCLDITKSLAYHGFEKILVVNGHGSNSALVDLVARKTVLETDSLCASLDYFSLTREIFEGLRDSETIAHADELETSLYLFLAPERVRMDRAVAGDDRHGVHMSSDSTSEFPARFHDYWGRWTTSGVHGDPTKATAEKGKALFEAAVTALVELVGEWRKWPLSPRNDQHTGPVQKHLRW